MFCSQCCAHSDWCLLCSQVLELEQQHSAALQELAHTFNTEKQKLDTQHQLNLQVCVCVCRGWELRVFVAL